MGSGGSNGPPSGNGNGGRKGAPPGRIGGTGALQMRMYNNDASNFKLI